MPASVAAIAIILVESATATAQPTVAPAPPVDPTPHDDARRLAAARAIVPPGSTCLPPAVLDGTLALEFARRPADTHADICAIDRDPQRFLGPVACWNVDLATGALAYLPPTPIPGGSLRLLAGGRCIRGFCPARPDQLGFTSLSWNRDRSKVALLSHNGSHRVDIFDAATRKRERGFALDEGMVYNDLHWIGDTLFIDGHPSQPAGERVAEIHRFTLAGRPEGVLAGPSFLHLYMGSFLILDDATVAIAERGFLTLTTFHRATGRRTRITRTVADGPCTADEQSLYWIDIRSFDASDTRLSAACAAHMDAAFAHLIGADAIAGPASSLVVLARGKRAGELLRLDAKNLREQRAIQLPRCGP